MANSANQIDVRKVLLFSASGRTADFTYIYSNITMRESMSMTAISGSITVEDDHDHFEILPIIGQEDLRIELEFMEEPYVFNFRVYKIGEVKKVSARSSEYTLYFVSHEMVANEKNRVSRSYRDTLYSAMIQDILETDIGTSKPISVVTTSNNATHVVPNVRPFKAINQIARKCISEVDGLSNFVFFEDKRGFIAAPITAFLTKRPKYTYRYMENVGPEGLNEYINDPFVINKLDMVKQSDSLDLLNQGFFASQLHSIDILQRKIDVYEYNYFDIFDEMKHINRYPLFFSQEEFEVEGQQYFAYSTETAVDNAYVADNDSEFIPDLSSQFRARRMIQNMMFSNYVINMSITGNPLLNIGDILDIDLVANANKTEERQHKILAGKTMVTAITHIIGTGRSYFQRVETVKDSVSQDLEEAL